MYATYAMPGDGVGVRPSWRASVSLERISLSEALSPQCLWFRVAPFLN